MSAERSIARFRAVDRDLCGRKVYVSPAAEVGCILDVDLEGCVEADTVALMAHLRACGWQEMKPPAEEAPLGENAKLREQLEAGATELAALRSENASLRGENAELKRRLEASGANSKGRRSSAPAETAASPSVALSPADFEAPGSPRR